MPTTDEFLRAAASACARWAYDPVAIEVMSHSENVVCDVALPDGSHVVMRLHRPGYNTTAELRSEVGWVASLGASGVPVPRPIPTASGEYYVLAEVGDERRHVGVIEWVDGTPLGSPLNADMADRDLVAHYGRIGEVAAAIRAHHAGWQPPTGFVRRRWDADGLMGTDPVWGRFWEADGLTTSQRRLFSDARSHLYDTLSALSTDGDRFGLIHSDLHLGNVMADGDHLTVIDFDDSGFGWFAHELAVALHPVFGEAVFADARHAIVDGYRRVHPLADDEVELIDTFLIVRSLMIIGWLNDRPEVPTRRFFGEIVGRAEDLCRTDLGAG